MSFFPPHTIRSKTPEPIARLLTTLGRSMTKHTPTETGGSVPLCARCEFLAGRRAKHLSFSCGTQLTDWLQSIEDRELLKLAEKMDISLADCMPLDEFFKGQPEPDGRFSHWRTGEFGDDLLRSEYRKELKQFIRQRNQTFRKERRETIEVYIKITSAVTGLAGATIGIISIIKK